MFPHIKSYKYLMALNKKNDQSKINESLIYLISVLWAQSKETLRSDCKVAK